MSEPVFLLSSERSGSNLLRVMLDSHSDFSAPHSPHLLKTFIPLLKNYGDLNEQGNLQELAADMLKVVNIQLRDWPFVPDVDSILKNVERRSFPGLMCSLYSLAAQNAGKTRSFVKDNGTIPLATEVATLFPNCKFVYLVRDARDVALSWKKSPGHPGGVKEAARMWCKEQSESLYFLSMIHQTNRVLVVHYENLVADSRGEIEKICRHLEVPFDDNMLKFYEGAEAKTSADAAVGWENLVKPVMKQNTAKYKDNLSNREQQTIERIAGVPMVQLGYELDHPPTKPLFDVSTFGKLFRAGRVAIKQLLRGPAGIAELKQRTKRLAGLREIIKRKNNDHPDWSGSLAKQSGDSDNSK